MRSVPVISSSDGGCNRSNDGIYSSNQSYLSGTAANQQLLLLLHHQPLMTGISRAYTDSLVLDGMMFQVKVSTFCMVYVRWLKK